MPRIIRIKEVLCLYQPEQESHRCQEARLEFATCIIIRIGSTDQDTLQVQL